jgi:hypothetical protein
MRFICPGAVRAELDAGVAKGYPDVRPSWLTVAHLALPLFKAGNWGKLFASDAKSRY